MMRKRLHLNRPVIGAIVVACIFVSLGLYSYIYTRNETIKKIKSAKAPTELSWFVDYSWFNGNYPDSLVYKEITKQTEVKIHFETPMEGNDNTLDSLIGQDELPDIITLAPNIAEYNKLINEKKVMSLNTLADIYDSSFYDVTDPVIRDYYTLKDGNIYCYPNAFYTPNDFKSHDNIASNVTFLVRKDIYEAIGCPDMTTLDGFHNAVLKAEEQFPEVDGKSLIPIGGRPFTENASPSFDDYLQDLLAVPYEKNGEYYDRNLDEEYIAYLRLFRKMNEEGLISPEIFLNDQNEINENIEDGRYFCMIYPRTDLVDQELARYNRDPSSIYIAIDGPKNSKGDDYVLPTNGMAGWTVTMISKKCRNPEAAIKLIDFLLSDEGQKLTYLGVEGVTYDTVNGRPVLKQGIRNYMRNDRQTYNEKYCADYNLWMLMDLVKQLDIKQELEEPLAQMEQWTYPYASYTGYYDIYLPENSRLGVQYLQLKKLWGKTLKKLMICGSDKEFDTILADYKKERYNYGYEFVHAEETRQMEENKKK